MAPSKSATRARGTGRNASTSGSRTRGRPGRPPREDPPPVDQSGVPGDPEDSPPPVPSGKGGQPAAGNEPAKNEQPTASKPPASGAGHQPRADTRATQPGANAPSQGNASQPGDIPPSSDADEESRALELARAIIREDREAATANAARRAAQLERVARSNPLPPDPRAGLDPQQTRDVRTLQVQLLHHRSQSARVEAQLPALRTPDEYAASQPPSNGDAVPIRTSSPHEGESEVIIAQNRTVDSGLSQPLPSAGLLLRGQLPSAETRLPGRPPD